MRRSSVVRVALSIFILAGAVALAVRQGGTNLVSLASEIPPAIYAAILACLIFNAITAAARFSFIAAQVGGACQFRSAVAIVSASNIAGALFFQIAGQLAARGALMARFGNGSFANAVVITAYERLWRPLCPLSARWSALIPFSVGSISIGATARNSSSWRWSAARRWLQVFS